MQKNKTPFLLSNKHLEYHKLTNVSCIKTFYWHAQLYTYLVSLNYHQPHSLVQVTQLMVIQSVTKTGHNGGSQSILTDQEC